MFIDPFLKNSSRISGEHLVTREAAGTRRALWQDLRSLIERSDQPSTGAAASRDGWPSKNSGGKIPPNHPMFNGVFQYFYHPFLGFSPYFWKQIDLKGHG